MKDFHIHLKKGIHDYDVMKEYIDRCIELGIDEVVFLDHGNRVSSKHHPVLTDQKIIQEFFKMVRRARREYKNITIHTGIEVDYFPDRKRQKQEIDLMNSGFDYILASVHGVKELNLDENGYYQAILDVVKKYPLQILAHLKLYDDYLEHDDMIRKILMECGKKNVMIEINTSDRSIWSLEQFQYMFHLFQEYHISYTVGSDAHAIEEIGMNYSLVMAYLNHEIHTGSREIQYNIVSRGTEKAGSKGYMAITKKIHEERHLIVQDHENALITHFKDSLPCYHYDIHTIAFSRFELIGALALQRISFSDDILLCGLGNVGVTALIYLLDHDYRNIRIYIDSVKPYIQRMIRKLNKQYGAQLRIVDRIELAKTYIDTTGASSVLEAIFQDIKPFCTVFLIGTPRDGSYLIDPLCIHRNNLLVVGGHELKGIKKTERLRVFQELLEKNDKNPLLKDIVHINRYRKNIFMDILNEKKHFIEVVEYDNLH